MKALQSFEAGGTLQPMTAPQPRQLVPSTTPLWAPQILVLMELYFGVLILYQWIGLWLMAWRLIMNGGLGWSWPCVRCGPSISL